MRQINIPNTLKICRSSAELITELRAVASEPICLVHSGARELSSLVKTELNIQDEIITKGQAYTLEDLDALKFSDASCFIGLGGGSVLDIAKYLASRTKQGRFISLPTLVSHDGICSPVAVIGGKSVGAVMPSAILVPLDLVKQAPLRYIHAGIGDLISNISALDDWRLAEAAAKDIVDDFSALLSRNAALNTLRALKLGYDLHSDEFLSTLVDSLNLAGIAMSIAGSSRPCSGAEHMISHAIDQIYGAGTKAEHGVQVAIATIYLGHYRRDPIYSEITQSLRAIGFPTSFKEIGINETELERILELAPSTRAGRYTILDEI